MGTRYQSAQEEAIIECKRQEYLKRVEEFESSRIPNSEDPTIALSLLANNDFRQVRLSKTAGGEVVGYLNPQGIVVMALNDSKGSVFEIFANAVGRTGEKQLVQFSSAGSSMQSFCTQFASIMDCVKTTNDWEVLPTKCDCPYFDKEIGAVIPQIAFTPLFDGEQPKR